MAQPCLSAATAQTSRNPSRRIKLQEASFEKVICRPIVTHGMYHKRFLIVYALISFLDFISLGHEQTI